MTDDQTIPHSFDSPRTLFVNNLVAAVLATWVMILLHELVHLLVARVNGYPSRLFPFAVQSLTEPTPAHLAAEAISAPIFSLVTGFAFAAWLPFRRDGGFLHLWWLWFAFTSIMEGVGYLVITPFGAGDTAVTADALGWPLWARFVIMALGIVLQFGAAYLFAPHVVRHAGTDRARSWAMAFWPWMAGTVISVALALLYVITSPMQLTTGETVAVGIGPLAVLVFAPMSFIFQGRFRSQPPRPLRLKAVPWVAIGVLVALVVFNLVVLRPGLRFG